MKKITPTIYAILFAQLAFGQQIIWNSLSGGTNNNGAVISYNLQNNQLSTLASLEGNFLRGISYNLDQSVVIGDNTISNGLILGSDGMLYGVHTAIDHFSFGENETGGIYKLDPNSGMTTLLHSFSGNNIENPAASVQNYLSFNQGLGKPVLGLIQATNNKLYGITEKGGAYNLGGIYCYDLSNGTYTKLVDFSDQSGGLGYQPTSPLIEGPNDDLFGVLNWSSNNGNGWLYKVDITNNTVSIVSSLEADGYAIAGTVMQISYNASENKIYGTKEEFAGLDAGGGVYSYNFNNQTVTNEAIITTGQTATLGSYGNGMSPVASDGFLYFTTRDAGANGEGCLLKYNTATDVITKVHDFTLSSNGNGLIVHGDFVYGTYNALSDSDPQIWSYNVSTQIFANVVSSSSSNTIGYLTQHQLAILNGEIYGHNMKGIGSDAGCLFKVNLQSDATSVVHANQSTAGRGLTGDILIEGDSVAYTFISSGGVEQSTGTYSEQGGIAKIDLLNGLVKLDTTKSKYLEVGSDVRTDKYNRILKSSSGKYYVSTLYKLATGSASRIKQIDPISGADINIKVATVSSEMLTSSCIEFSNGKIAFVMGDSIHIYDEATQGLTSHSLSLAASESAYNNLLLASDGKIYFRTIDLAASGQSKLISVDTTTWTPSVVHTFTGIYEHNNGLNEVNSKLYGSTFQGGTNDEGYLYSIDILNGNAFTIEHNFDASSDGGGFTGEWLHYNGKLYGVSYTGGANGYGTLAEFDLASGNLTVLEDLDISNGRALRSSPTLWDDSILSISELVNHKHIEVYPNPASNMINIDNSEVETIKIFNLSGKLILTEQNSNQINVEAFSKGIYFLSIQTKNGLYTSKFVKE